LLDDMAAGYLSGANADDAWLTVDDGTGPVAVAYYAPEPMTDGTWNLRLIAVHPDRQGRGHGVALTRAVERTLAARGARVLLVETSGLPAFARRPGVLPRLRLPRGGPHPRVLRGRRGQGGVPEGLVGAAP
jgi:GNAT superfamily N-acetyltransferase